MTKYLLALVVVAAVHYRVGCDCVGGRSGPGGADGGADGGLDLAVPNLIASQLNDGADFARGRKLRLAVRVVGGAAPLLVRAVEVAAGTACQQAFADADWRPYAEPSLHDVVVSAADGPKKICAWAKDSAGLVTTNADALGVDMDELVLQTTGIPVVERLEVANNVIGPRFGGTVHDAGDPLRIGFTVTDPEALAESPIELSYTTAPVADEQWLPIVSSHGASGGGTSYSGDYLAFAAPTTQPFRIRLVATDAAGHRSLGAISDLQNSAQWGVYAGNADRGFGGSALATRLSYTWDNSSRVFAIHPLTNDVYAMSHYDGVIRIDAHTGLTERVIFPGTPNLPDDGPLPARPTAFTKATTIEFDSKGRLYIVTGGGSLTSGRMYQVDFAAGHVRLYLGGGTQFGAGATPSTVFLLGSTYGFDEDDSLYFFTSCTPGSWTAGTTPTRMMKATQAADGTAGTVSVVAGTCVTGTTPAGPSDALTVPLGGVEYPSLGTVTAWDQGRKIYFALNGFGPWKIIDGQLSSSNIAVDPVTQQLAYNRFDGRIYSARVGVTAWTPNLTPTPGGDQLDFTLANGTGTPPACLNDGVDAGEACVAAHYTMRVAQDGTVLFMDGPRSNGGRPYRIRFVDGGGKVRTLAGMLPLEKPGLDRRRVRAQFAGIHYKTAVAPNQTAFPEGLYFVDGAAMVFGHIGLDDKVAVDLGNQSTRPLSIATGTDISPALGLGVDYLGNVMALAFDDTGLPWLRYGPSANAAHLLRIDAARKTVALQTGTTSWENAPDGTSPESLDIWPYGFAHNLVLKGSGSALIVGGYTSYAGGPQIKLFDFAGNTTERLMGSATGNGYSADTAVPGAVRTATLSAQCFNTNDCPSTYRADEDRFYFVEGTRLRYIQTPSTPANATLGTLWTTTDSIENLIFDTAGTALFYTRNGELYCHAFGTTDPNCNDTVLGPPQVLSRITRGPNQLTWKDANTLLISNYEGEIYEYRR